jgi:hypothetical protein
MQVQYLFSQQYPRTRLAFCKHLVRQGRWKTKRSTMTAEKEENKADKNGSCVTREGNISSL